MQGCWNVGVYLHVHGYAIILNVSHDSGDQKSSPNTNSEFRWEERAEYLSTDAEQWKKSSIMKPAETINHQLWSSEISFLSTD